MKNNSNILTAVAGVAHYNVGAVEASIKFPKEQRDKMAAINESFLHKVLIDTIKWKQSIYMSIKNDLIAESLLESKGVTPNLYYMRELMRYWK